MSTWKLKATFVPEFSGKRLIPISTEYFTIFLKVYYVATAAYVFWEIFYILGLFSRRTGRQRDRDFVSVIIAARNEEKNLRACLQALAEQTYTWHNYEVIVVDDNSTDDTIKIVEELQRSYQGIRLVRITDEIEGFAPKKRAITEGIKTASGDLLLFTDADCVVKPTWIEAMVSNFEPRVGFLIGYSEVVSEHLRVREKFETTDFLVLMAATQGAANMGFPMACSGQNIGYRKEVFEQLGGFGAHKKEMSGDDVLFMQEVRNKTKWRIRFVSSEKAFVSTRATRSLGHFFSQRIRWASNFKSVVFSSPMLAASIGSILLYNLAFLVAIGLTVYSFILEPQLVSKEAGSWVIAYYKGWRQIIFHWTLARLAMDFIFLSLGAIIYRRADVIKFYPLWVLFQPFYTLILALLAPFRRYTWKGRSS